MTRFAGLIAAGMFITLPVAQAADRQPVGMVAPQHRIATSYAKQLARKVLVQKTHHGRWRLSAASRARMPLGGNMHLYATPIGNTRVKSRIATINIIKGKSAPKGLQRVKITPVRKYRTSAGRRNSGLRLVRHSDKAAGDYAEAVKYLKRPTGDLGSTMFWLRRAKDLGKQLGKKPLSKAFVAAATRQGYVNDMNHGLDQAAHSKRHGYGLELGLGRAVRSMQTLKLNGDQVLAALKRYGLTASDLAKNTDFKLAP